MSRLRLSGTRRKGGLVPALRGAGGQALVETLVLSLALLPLLFAVPLLAKYQDIRHATIAASRTAAFDCTVRFEDCRNPSSLEALSGELRRRHFARHDRDLLTRDGIDDGAPADQRNRFWVDRRGIPLLDRFADASVRLDESESDAVRGATSRAGTTPGGTAALAGPAGPGGFGLEVAGGMISARVRARVSNGWTVSAWLQRPEGLSLSLTGKTAVMVDAWNASSATGASPRSVASRVELGRRLPSLGDGAAWISSATAAAPDAALGGLDGAGAEEAIDLLYAPIRMLITGPLLAPVEPRGRLFRYHEVDVDLVPEDRVPPGRPPIGAGPPDSGGRES